MKGLLFTELLEMVEEDFGYNTANSIVLNADLRSKGIYTTSRSYHRTEMSHLFDQLHWHTKVSFETLSQRFGRHLCSRIMIAYPQHKAYINRIFSSITKRITDLAFQCVQDDETSLTIVYDPFVKPTCITDGVIRGYLAHLQQLSRVEETLLPDGKRKFVLRLK